MSFAQVVLPCRVGGFSTITVNMAVERWGGDNDRYAMRIKRIDPNGGVTYLQGQPEFAMRGDEDVVSWTWIDTSIPVNGNYTYRLQVRRLEGDGEFKAMTLIGLHHKV